MDLYELKEEQERVILVGVQTQDGDDTEESLKELEELVKTAGAVTVGTVIQSREAIHPGYYVGTGKLEEIRMAADAYDATGIVCDDELSPSQMNNLERELGLKIMDRTVVILDILLPEPIPAREKYRWNWPSFVTGRPDLPGWELPCPGWAEESVPEVRERKSWKWTDV